jgi:hypothetical protein
MEPGTKSQEPRLGTASFKLAQFPDRPVSTAGPKDSIGAGELKGVVLILKSYKIQEPRARNQDLELLVSNQHKFTDSR